MTIVAGFPDTGWVVLAADGEEGGSYAKSAVRKIATIRTENYTCVIGGAGDGDFIDLAVQETTQALKEPKPLTLETLRLTLEAVVTEVYDERIDELPADERANAGFQLLCGLWVKDAGVQLVKISRRLSLIRQRPEVIGIGGYLARYLIETLRNDDTGAPTPSRQTEHLCAYLLARVKANIKDCGGLSQILVLDANGAVREVPQFVISEDEFAAGIVMDRAVRLLFNWADPIGWQWDLGRLDRVIDDAAQQIKADFRTRRATLEAQLAATLPVVPPIQAAPTGDSPALPPSQV